MKGIEKNSKNRKNKNEIEQKNNIKTFENTKKHTKKSET